MATEMWIHVGHPSMPREPRAVRRWRRQTRRRATIDGKAIAELNATKSVLSFPPKSKRRIRFAFLRRERNTMRSHEGQTASCGPESPVACRDATVRPHQQPTRNQCHDSARIPRSARWRGSWSSGTAASRLADAQQLPGSAARRIPLSVAPVLESRFGARGELPQQTQSPLNP